MTQRKGLEARIQARWLNRGDEKLFVHVHARAELERLARKIRKLKRPIDTAGYMVWNDAVYAVLVFIRRAKK
jgi:hypothetical protein